MHALELACLISSYRIKDGHFPQNLDKIGGDIAMDFNTGKMWEYSNYGDSVTIFSPGPSSLKMDDDISLTLVLRKD